MFFEPLTFELLERRLLDVPTRSQRETRDWSERREELAELAGPILESRAFARLEKITFLGILSSRWRDAGPAVDGTRADHSLGVAAIALDFARSFDLSEEGQRYAVAWGLTHDLGTWPLSHTSEPAFEEILDVTTRDVRSWMLLGKKGVPSGKKGVPSQYWLAGRLRDCGLDPQRLVELFDRIATPEDPELALLRSLIHSPITPDTLEGIGRAGRAFGVSVPEPEEIRREVWRDGDRIRLEAGPSSAIASFWKAKARIYGDFINRPEIIDQESAVAREIRLNLGSQVRSLGASLDLSEDQVFTTTLWQTAMPVPVFRYKTPQDYRIAHDRWHLVANGAPLESLSQVLLRSPGMQTSHVDA